jgi:hypothetical protein
MSWPRPTFEDLEKAIIALEGLVWLVHQDSYDGEIIIVDEIEGAMLLATRTAYRKGLSQHSSLGIREMQLLEKRHFIRREEAQDGISQTVRATDEGFEACELFHLMEKYDHDLLVKCFELILDHRFDTAIREASLVLETRLKQIIGSTSWGVNLVNEAFGSKGKLGKRFTDDSKRQGMRDLMAGVMGVIRNDYAHNFRHPSRTQTVIVIGFIGTLLDRLNELTAQS